MHRLHDDSASSDGGGRYFDRRQSDARRHSPDDVVQLSSFPSILLLTTLFRLALEVTTTRLILIQADAGHIVETFGEFVVAGNLIVGLVVFLILTIVNFMVITKGSERVAEVSARFSLDSMPGKQMSIDSDMRAGQIELDEAKRRRNKLEKESQLYGAMDGAMKFVKGDAIAGMIIIAVNMIGGITIGTMQNGMSVTDAMQRYSLLTIGDGLVSQIPALFISITAGFIVTRVSSEENRDLGSDIAAQIMNEPKALLITAVILVIFAVVPGFPTMVFLSLSVLCGGGGWWTIRKRRNNVSQYRSKEMPALAATLSNGPAPSFPAPNDDVGPATEPVTFALTVPLIVDIASTVRNSIRPEKLDREVARVRRALYFDLGVPFPGINLRLNDNLKDGQYRIVVNEIPVASGAARPGWFIARETEANLQMFDIPFERGEDFLPNTPSYWVSMKYLPVVERAGIQIMTLSNMLTLPSGPCPEGSCIRIHRHPRSHVSYESDAKELRRTHAGGHPHSPYHHHHGRLSKTRRRRHFDPGSANGSQVAGGMGAAREGSDRACRTCSRLARPLHHA
jgi:type III secretion protein V